MDIYLLCLAAALGGAVNAVAGGGTLLTFPALLAVLGRHDQAEVVANATSTVALWPGSLAGAWGYRHEVVAERKWLARLFLPSLFGGLAGALLITELPPDVFRRLVPWLILIATALFALQPRIARKMGIGLEHQPTTRRAVALVVAAQFVIGIYGGYFGAGIGILMLSTLALLGMADIHRMNAVKTILAAAINGVAVVVFVTRRAVDWNLAPPMIAAAIVGAYAAARVAKRLDRNRVRRLVVAIGLALAAYYFVQHRVG